MNEANKRTNRIIKEYSLRSYIIARNIRDKAEVIIGAPANLNRRKSSRLYIDQLDKFDR
jgi:hypothetical protein